MVTITSLTARGGERLVLNAEPCPACGEPVAWMRTHSGLTLPFDPQTFAREYDEGCGWVPGRFPGRRRLVMAPLHLHPRDKRDRVRSVMYLHRCVLAA